MKRILCLLCAVMLLGITALASDSTTCTVQAAAVTAGAGETVDVTVSVVGNPGFTNYAILLDYDREALTLQSITPAESELLTAVSTDYKAADGKSYGFVSAAAETEQAGDGVLFTASFLVSSDFAGEVSVTPIVQYMRNNTADYRIFAEVHATSVAGSVMQTVEAQLFGDVDGDGYITAIDAARAYSASLGRTELSGAAFTAADVDTDGYITAMDAVRIFKQSLGG